MGKSKEKMELVVELGEVKKQVERLEKDNKFYRDLLRDTRYELRDFRKDANTIFKLTDRRNWNAKDSSFRLQCDIRDYINELDRILS